MKKLFYIAILSAVMVASAISTSARPQPQNDWKQKMMSEKIAFLTMELGITPEEAQKFWPIYNEVDKKRDEAMFNVFSAFQALENGVSQGKSEKEIENLLEKYLEAMEEQRDVEDEAAEKYLKVLSVDKVAKLYVGEEKFRRQHIRRLHERPDKKR